MMSTGRSRFPFTASQWQELEHQALIFKYMASGMPIPPDLLYSVRRSLDSSLSSKLMLHQPQHIGWNCFQVGFGRKIDPEPGRCRRTDGKKWRCSKEAYPDSKYCERHMHRGRNRSRKPVEVLSTTATASSTTITSPPSNNNTTRPTPTAIPISSISKDSSDHSISSLPFAYALSASSRPPGLGFSTHDNASYHLLDSSPYSHTGKDYRNSYGHGMKEEVGEHSFFSDTSGTMRTMSGSASVDDPWHLTMGSPLGHLNQRDCSGLQSDHSSTYLQLQQSLDESNARQQRQQQDPYQHYYGFPREAKSDDQPKKVMHHFIDEWPPKDKDSWLDSEDKLSINDASLSRTSLSISMPNSAHDFLMTRNDK